MEITDRCALHWFSTEMLVAYQFCKQGYTISVPLSPCQYDLLADNGGKVWRIQVKKAWFNAQQEKKAGLSDRDHWKIDLTKRKRNGNGGSSHKRISAEEFDYLAVVCQEDRVYVIPKEKLLALGGEHLVRVFRIKPPVPASGRSDSIKAGLRWEPFLNKFELPTRHDNNA